MQLIYLIYIYIFLYIIYIVYICMTKESVGTFRGRNHWLLHSINKLVAIVSYFIINLIHY